MAIEIGFLSVVLLKDSLEQLPAPRREVAEGLFRWKPEWFREDPYLIATTFMAPSNTRAFCEALRSRTGLELERDWTVVDMLLGPRVPVPWLSHHLGAGQIMGVWKTGEEVGELVRVPGLMPPGVRTVSQAFYRDSIADPDSREEDFGTLLPTWGGVHLWLCAEKNESGQPSGALPERWISLDTSGLDFMNWQVG